MKFITLAIPCKGSVQARFNMCLFQVVNQIHTMTGYKPILRFLIGKSNIVHARSILLTEWYDKAGEDDLFLFLDSDQTFTIDDVISVIKQEGDVVAGIYVNGAGFPTCYPLNVNLFKEGKDKRLLYCGCGFMLIRKPIVTAIMGQMEKEGPVRYAISRDGSTESSVVPFFQPKLLEQSEMSENDTPKGDWLGEDYSFCWRVRNAGGRVMAMFSRTLGHEIPQVSLLPEGYFPQDTSPLDEKSIVYFCGHSIVQFSPEMKSLGGSEKAVVEISRAWAKKGYKVHVYGNVWPGTYDGVEYLDSRDFDIHKRYSTLILWRSLGASILPRVNAKTILIDLHDIPLHELYSEDLLEEKRVKICVKSQFHRQLLSHLPDKFFYIQPNGLERELMERRRPIIPSKKDLQFIWTSSYDRGLPEFLTKGWPLIRQRFPDATLKVFYGMSLCAEEFQEEMTGLFEKMKLEGVTDYGKCSMEEIVKEKWRSTYHVYVSEFPEIDCLSIRESVYCDCIPLCASHAVFNERPCVTIGQEFGSRMYSTSIWDQMINILNVLESDKDKKEKVIVGLKQRLIEQKLDASWDTVAEQWIEDLL
jgi:hypothetical protein